MFDKFCKRFLPIYIRLWPSLIWLAIWSAPTHYHSHGIQGHQKDTYWQALRITIRYGEYHSIPIFTIKKGVI